MDVVAKHGPDVSVAAAYRRASECHKGGSRQRISQVLRVAHLVAGSVFGWRIVRRQGG